VVVVVLVVAGRRHPVERPDRRPQHWRDSGALVEWHAVLERHPSRPFSGRCLERQQDTLALLSCKLQIR